MVTYAMPAIPTTSFNFEDLLSLSTRIVWGAFALYALIVFIATARNYGLVIALIRLISVRIIGPLLIPIAFTLFTMALIFVPPQEVGVVISLLSPGGIRPQPVRAGLHWVVPILEWEETYPIYWQTYTMSGISAPNNGDGGIKGEGPQDSIRARTSDGQEVHLDTSIIFRIDEQQVVAVHVEWQNRYVTDLVSPLIRGVVRSQISQFTAREVNSSARRDLEITLDRQLREQLGEKGLIVDRFLLRDITFSPEFVAAIESKQVAVEQRDQANYEAERMRTLAQGEADAAITRANGQAQSLKLIADALAQSDDLITYQYVEKLAPNIRVMLVPNNAPFILPLPNLETMEPITATVANPPAETEETTQEITPTQTLSVTTAPSVTIPVSPTVPVSGTVGQ
ncbi:MAG: SPFH domain-containing protein [Caldilineaceae bacterium]